MSPGKLITFEGVEGSGKSTLLTTLSAALRSAGQTIHVWREPGGSSVGEAIRGVVLDAGRSVDPWTELFLMLAARAQLVAELVEPALARGETVFCDRYMDSSVVYQGIARGLGRRRVEQLNRWATRSRVPDLTVLVDLPPEVGRDRRGDAGDRMERESMDFHHRVRDGYLEIAQDDPGRFVVLDGHRAPDELAEDGWAALCSVLPGLPSQLP